MSNADLQSCNYSLECVDTDAAVAVTVAITSTFCDLPFTNLWQHSTIPSGKSKDLASTFLVPLGTRAITASGFIGFKIGDAGVVWSLPLLFPNDISSKKPFATSFIVPSPPNAKFY
jgi:hypothetical protein